MILGSSGAMESKFDKTAVVLQSNRSINAYINFISKSIARQKYTYHSFIDLTDRLDKWSKSNELSIKLDEKESRTFHSLSHYVFAHAIKNNEKLDDNFNKIYFENIVDVNDVPEDVIEDYDDLFKLPLRKNNFNGIFALFFGGGMIIVAILLLFVTVKFFIFSIPISIFGILLLFYGYSIFRQNPKVLVFKIKDDILRFYDSEVRGEYYLPDLTRLWILRNTTLIGLPYSKYLVGLYQNSEIHLLDIWQSSGKFKDKDINEIISFILKHNPFMKIGYE